MELKCIDVSSHQRVIDWEKVKASGIEAAIIRTGCWHGVNDKKMIDEYFRSNMTNAHKAGIKYIGTYWFCYALSDNEALEEAKQYVNAMDEFKDIINLPAFFDFEYDTVNAAKKRGVTLTKTNFNSFCKIFCEYVKSKGYTPGVYYNLDYERNWVDSNVVSNYVKWLAHYTITKDTSYDMQQYSSAGSVNGIYGNVDMNYIFNEKIISNYENTSTTTTAVLTREERIKKYNIKLLQQALNTSYKTSLTLNGIYDTSTKRIVDKYYLYYKASNIKNEHVKWLQKMFSKIGYTIVIDGIFGKQTNEVLLKFQKKNGLEVDGYAGVKTHEKVIEVCKAKII